MVIYCPQCRYPNPLQSSTCQKCGASVSSSSVTNALPDIEEHSRISPSPEENKHENDVSLSDETIPKVSEEWRTILKTCGAHEQGDAGREATYLNLEKAHDTQRLNYTNEEDYSLKAGTVHFQGNLILRHVASNTEFIILNRELQEAVVIGRSDKNSGITPTIDLTNLENKSNAISRRHVIIHEHTGLLLIVDQNSTNGTYLNGQHLVPYQPRVLRDKDVLWLGKVQLLVCFRCPED